MKRTETFILFLISTLLSNVPVALAQVTGDVPPGYELVDSVIYRSVSAVDTMLAGRDIFRILPSKSEGGNQDVVINQTSELETAMRRHIAENRNRTISGYRVRIFFDNRQTARVESEDALKNFMRLYHDIPAYRTYANPYFKVTVGDFRTRSEAVRLLERIKSEFPSAFIVKENVCYPVADEENAFVADTVKVLRPKKRN